MCSCGEGVLAKTAVIGLPEIAPNYRLAAVHSCTRPSWICPKARDLEFMPKESGMLLMVCLA